MSMNLDFTKVHLYTCLFYQAQVELTARSLSQYEELAKLQVAKAEKEKERMVVESELTATTRELPDSQIKVNYTQGGHYT